MLACVQSLQSCPAVCIPMDCSLPSSSVHGITLQEYWSGLQFPPPGYLPVPGIEPVSYIGMCLCSGGWSWISSLWSAMKCPVMSYEMSMVWGWLWAACILELRAVFLCCWRICLVCLALELVGPCVVLGFSVGMEVFDELLSINVPWSQEFPGVRVWT